MKKDKPKTPHTAGPKPAEVHIKLPDGTQIDAVGPMAEAMARRLMDNSYLHGWPYAWYQHTGNGLRWNTNQVYGNYISMSQSGANHQYAQRQAQTQQTAPKQAPGTDPQHVSDVTLPGVNFTSSTGLTGGSVTVSGLSDLLAKGLGAQEPKK